MASILTTQSGTYRVQWREDGKMRQKNFKTKADAKKFAALIVLTPQQKGAKITVRDLLQDYRDRVTPTKRGARSEDLRIGGLMERSFATKLMSELTPRDIERFVSDRLQDASMKYPTKTISPSTVARELNTLGAVLSDAVRRGLIAKNPVSGVRKPQQAPHRERIATDDDIEKLLLAAGWDGESVPADGSQLVMCLFLLACRTGMRSGEMLRIEESWIDGRVIHLPREATKTNTRRDVAVGREAMKYLRLILAMGERPVICGGMSDETRDVLFRRIRDRAGLGPVLDSEGRVIKEGLNFHDSRATFATWAASPDPKTKAPRLDVLALARQTGHKDLKMLQRYYRASAEDVADRL